MYDALYLKLIGWPILLFFVLFIEFSRNNWVKTHLFHLSAGFASFAIISTLLLWQASFSGYFLLMWGAGFLICPPAMALGKKIISSTSSDGDNDSDPPFIRIAAFLCIGAICVIYSLLPHASIFSCVPDVADIEVLFSRLLYFLCGAYALCSGIFAARKCKTSEKE